MNKEKWNFLMLDNRIFNFCEKKLINSTDFLLFVFLTKFLDPSKSNSIVFPGNRIIEKEIGLKKSTVQNSLKNLERVGLIKRINNKNNHKRKIQINLRVVADEEGKFKPLRWKCNATYLESGVNIRRREQLERQEKRRRDSLIECEEFKKNQIIENQRFYENDDPFW